MDRFLYFFARIVVTFVQAMPLLWAARLGRFGGTMIFWLDKRHRMMALQNLTFCFDQVKSPQEIRALALENFRRIGENYCSAVRTASMNETELRSILEVRGAEGLNHPAGEPDSISRVFATGHFGNFELFTRLGLFVKGFQCAATYRGIRQPSLNRFLHSLRSESGILLFERRTGAADLKKAMNKGGLLLTLVSDQSTRDNGLELLFFGRPCLSSRAPAVMALRYHCALFVPICYRISLGRWVIEIGEPVPTLHEGQRRSSEELTRDINARIEAAVRRDPANWFWVHNRWKTHWTNDVPATAEAEGEITTADDLPGRAANQKHAG